MEWLRSEEREKICQEQRADSERRRHETSRRPTFSNVYNYDDETSRSFIHHHHHQPPTTQFSQVSSQGVSLMVKTLLSWN